MFSIRFVTVLLSFLLFPVISSASTVFLIQLGSFENEAASQAAWKSYQSEHARLLKELSPVTSRITLPPENNSTYRLQAGPIESRVEAKSICKALRRSKAECFVVETAMFIGNESDTQIADAPSPTSPSSSLLNDASDVIDEIAEALTAPFAAPASGTEEALIVASEIAKEGTVEKEESNDSAPAVETPAPSAKASLPWLRRDKRARIIQRTQPVRSSTPAKPARLQKAKEQTKEAVAYTSPARTRMKSEVIMQKLPGVKMVEAETKAQPVVKTPPAKVAEIPATKKPSVPEITLPTASVEEGSVKVAEAIAVPLSDITQATRKQMESSAVNTGLPVFKGRKLAALRGDRNATSSRKPLWVKLGYFESESSAENYWQSLKRKHNNLTQNLRKRLITPYKTRSNSVKTSMQLGPFNSYQQVQSFCRLASSPKVVCQILRDPKAIAKDGTILRNPKAAKEQTDNAQKRDKAVNQKSSRFWVQTGSYRNRGDAMRVWRELKSRHALLKPYHPHLAHPAPNRSSERNIYRLRTGPFVTRTAAQKLCDELNAGSTPCIVVNE